MDSFIFMVKNETNLEQVQQLAVVHLQQHAGDLCSLVLVAALDKREETLANHLLLVWL